VYEFVVDVWYGLEYCLVDGVGLVDFGVLGCFEVGDVVCF